MINLGERSERSLESELEALESEISEAGRTRLRFTIGLNLGRWGFRPTTRFLDDWIKYSVAGLVGTTFNFRKRFCEANHFEVNLQLSGRNAKVRVAEIWGLPMIYSHGDSAQPRLVAILPRGWHLSQVGQSVRPPRFCKLRPRKAPWSRPAARA